ncbi:DUF5134 domain-containing protein [Streptomyces tremellae]|uniref:DUF5134 domain-containing protein n=1 Tax=Streptomyces tremellae TaxID=1124239 RepID=A0ABP7EHF4_9ACTN
MHAPLVVSWLLVAVCAGSGAYCVVRARSTPPPGRATARGEALMGFGMAAMALPVAAPAPPGWVWTGYAALFGAGALAAGAGAAVRRGLTGHHLHHLLGMAAMAYMAWAMAAAPEGGATVAGMAGMAGMKATVAPPAVTGALLLYFAGYVLWAGARLLPGAVVAGAAGGRGAAQGGTGPRWGERPELALACRLSMATAMVAMLLTL